MKTVNNQRANAPVGRSNPRASKATGFTLVELMIGLLLGVFLIGGVTLTYLAGRAAYQDGQELSRIQENLRFASDFLIRDIRLAGFRDDLTLTISEQNRITEQIAKIDDNGNLVIRYAGRHHCAESRAVGDRFWVVENRYSIEERDSISDSFLRCSGRKFRLGDDGEIIPGSSGSVDLTRGVSGLDFVLLDENGDETTTMTTCTSDNGCLGVKLTLTLEAFDADRSVDLHVAFRNNVLDRIYDR